MLEQTWETWLGQATISSLYSSKSIIYSRRNSSRWFFPCGQYRDLIWRWLWAFVSACTWQFSFTIHSKATLSNKAKHDDLSWLVDSGASNHVTSNPSSFSNFSVLHHPRKIILADGSSTPALGQGRVDLTPDLSLDNVLLVSAFPTSLLSVKKLCDYLHCCAVFTKSVCLFQDVVSQKELGRGSNRNGLKLKWVWQ